MEIETLPEVHREFFRDRLNHWCGVVKAEVIAKTIAEQRQQQKKLRVTKIELFLDGLELEMLQRNCELRRPEKSQT